MSKVSQFKRGQFFAAPLLGGGYGYGYFTSVDVPLMKLVNAYDRLGQTPDIPEDIETAPLIVESLPIGGSEFTLSSKRAAEDGERWILSDRILADPPLPQKRFFIQGRNTRPVVIDVLGEQPDRPATPAELKALPTYGSDFPPTTTNTIEVALRRIDIDPDDFYPEDFPRQ